MKLLRRSLFPTLLALVCSAAAQAEVQSRTVPYEHDGVPLQGFMAWDDALTDKRPGVIVVHEWWGLNDYARKRAEMLAHLGYVAFAVDMYGKDKVTEHPQQAGEWAKQIQANVQNWRERALLGLDILRNDEHANPDQLAAIGYCFGGATVMQMAYAGALLDGVVSFHGSLPVATKDQSDQIQAKILVAHGSADAFVPQERIVSFQKALDEAGADWQMIYYGGAHHSFTNPNAGTHGIPNLRYDPKADERSWEHMLLFFDEIFSTES